MEKRKEWWGGGGAGLRFWNVEGRGALRGAEKAWKGQERLSGSPGGPGRPWEALGGGEEEDFLLFR